MPGLAPPGGASSEPWYEPLLCSPCTPLPTATTDRKPRLCRRLRSLARAIRSISATRPSGKLPAEPGRLRRTTSRHSACLVRKACLPPALTKTEEISVSRVNVRVNQSEKRPAQSAPPLVCREPPALRQFVFSLASTLRGGLRFPSENPGSKKYLFPRTITDTHPICTGDAAAPCQTRTARHTKLRTGRRPAGVRSNVRGAGALKRCRRRCSPWLVAFSTSTSRAFSLACQRNAASNTIPGGPCSWMKASRESGDGHVSW